MSTTDGSSPWPAGLHAERTGSALVITVRWRNLTAWALLPLALTATGFALALAIKVRQLRWNDPVQGIPLVFGLAAVSLLGHVLQRLINVTRLQVSAEKLTLAHGPLPWWRRRSWPSATFRLLEVRPSRWRYNGREVTHYHLWAVPHHGAEICLLGRDTTEEHAVRVRDELQRLWAMPPAAADQRAA